jgi:hypothetical protein
VLSAGEQGSYLDDMTAISFFFLALFFLQYPIASKSYKIAIFAPDLSNSQVKP